MGTRRSGSGSQPLSAVIEYAYPVTDKGLVFMDGPAYEAVSATGQIASGATLMARRAGRRAQCCSCPARSMRP